MHEGNEKTTGANVVERLKSLEQRAHAFQQRLDRFLDELGMLAPLQRRLLEESAEIHVCLDELRQATGPEG